MGFACQKERRVFRPILILGLEGSGKSTFTKQLRIHQDIYSPQELELFKTIILNNILTGIKELIRICKEQNFELETPNIKYSRWISLFVDTDEWDQEDGRKITSLWSDSAIQKAWRWPSELKTIEHLDYFVERVQVYLQPNYTPVREEILRARQRTTGFTETTYLDNENCVWTVIDVGGQFSERSKWIHLVSRCSSFIYVVAIDEYNVKSKENKTKSRLASSLDTFKEIINNEAYSQLFPILFLNKIDKFKSKLENSDLFDDFKTEYPSYKGSQDWKEAVKVIESEFRAAMPRKNLVVHHTCVLDGEGMKIVFAEVRQHILVQLLEHTLM